MGLVARQLHSHPPSSEQPLPYAAKFIDGDDYHTPANVSKMAEGKPLTDEDRAGWLSNLAGMIQDHLQRNQSVVVACSALKHSYRELLFGKRDAAKGDAAAASTAAASETPTGTQSAAAAAASSPSSVPRLFLVHLNGSHDLLLRRLTARKGHFFKSDLLASQLDTLEMPNVEEMDRMGVRYLCIDLDAAEKKQHDDPQKLGQQIADFIAQQQGLEGLYARL